MISYIYVCISSLRPVDVWVMKKLHHKVNIVPLIAKADMLTKIEVKKLKEKVRLPYVSMG